MSKVKFIGEKVSYKHDKDGPTTVVISSKIPRIKETLFTMWVAAWTFCGGVFIWQLFLPYTREEKLFLVGLVVFWAYFEWRTVRTWLFRKYGMEFIKFEPGVMVYKRALKRYGNARTFYLDNISEVSVIEKSDLSWSKNLESSFWVMGGQRVQLNYMGKPIRVGMQIDDKEAKGLAKLLNRLIKEYKQKPEIPVDEDESVVNSEGDSANA